MIPAVLVVYVGQVLVVRVDEVQPLDVAHRLGLAVNLTGQYKKAKQKKAVSRIVGESRELGQRPLSSSIIYMLHILRWNACSVR